MKRDVFEKLLNTMLSDSKVVDYVLFPRKTLTEDDNWVDETPAIFVLIEYNGVISNKEFDKLSNNLSSICGHEIIIEGVMNISSYNGTINFDNEQ